MRIVNRRSVSDVKRGYVIATVDRLRDMTRRLVQLHLAQFLSSLEDIMRGSKQRMWRVERRVQQRPVMLSLTYPPPASVAITSTIHWTLHALLSLVHSVRPRPIGLHTPVSNCKLGHDQFSAVFVQCIVHSTNAALMLWTVIMNLQ